MLWKLHLQLDFLYNLLSELDLLSPQPLHSLSAILPESVNTRGTVMTKIAMANKKQNTKHKIQVFTMHTLHGAKLIRAVHESQVH